MKGPNPNILLSLAALMLAMLSGCVSTAEHEALALRAEALRAELESCTLRLSDTDGRLSTLIESNAVLASRTGEMEARARELMDGLRECEFSVREREDECADRTLELNRTIEELRSEVGALAPIAARAGAEEDLRAASALLVADLDIVLAEYIKAASASVDVADGAVRVTLLNEAMYDEAPASLSGQGIKVLKIITDSLKRTGYKAVALESYTDDIEPAGSLKRSFPTNWELSSARAAAVAAYLSGPGGLRMNAISATGRSSNSPVADNSTREGRRMNRRLVLVITPATPEPAEETLAEPSADAEMPLEAPANSPPADSNPADGAVNSPGGP